MKRIVTLWKSWARRLRLEALTLYFAYRNPRTPWYAKVWSILVVAYAFSPIDLIPDFIPVLGLLDDLVLIPLGLAIAVKLIPKDVFAASRLVAQARIDDKRPVNWVAGGTVIGIWVLAIAYACYRLIQGIGK
jgi:uncharacterized membrane protein YkvA (DUF1232 family)